MGSKLVILGLLLASALFLGGCHQENDTSKAAKEVFEASDKGGGQPDPSLPLPAGAPSGGGSRSSKQKFNTGRG